MQPTTCSDQFIQLTERTYERILVTEFVEDHLGWWKGYYGGRVYLSVHMRFPQGSTVSMLRFSGLRLTIPLSTIGVYTEKNGIERCCASITTAMDDSWTRMLVLCGKRKKKLFNLSPSLRYVCGDYKSNA